MYKRDAVVVILSFVALFLCLQHEGTFSFRKAWYHVTLHDADKLEVLQDRLEDLPAPIVADLNGDGHLEVIIATHDYKLELVRPEPPGRAGEGFAPVQVVRSFSLIPQKILLGRDRRPVAMGVGFIDPEPVERVRPPRKQVLVVVTASWQVLAFDHNLALMWEATVEDKLPHNARLAEVSVIVTPHQVRQGMRGLVMVGGSLELGDVAGAASGASELGDLVAGPGGVGATPGQAAAAGAARAGGEGQLLENVLKEELRFEAEEAAKAHGGAGLTGRARGPGDGPPGGAPVGSVGGVDVSRHFSYYALEGGKGDWVWRHASGAFQKDLEGSAEELRPQEDYRMRADALAGRHFGELSCREFRESLLAVLPQSWNSMSDSRFEEALFVRHKEGAGQQKAQLARLAAAKAASGGRASHSSLHPRKQRTGSLNLAHVLNPKAGTTSSSSAAARARTGPGSGGHGLIASKSGSAAGPAGGDGHAGIQHRHAHLAHNASTNALVAHVQDGVEVVHIYSGRTLCKLHLAPNQLHADINGDGVIDHVAVGSAGSGAGSGPLSVSGGPRHAPLGPCTATATSGIPPKHTLWRTHVCAAHHNLGAALDGSTSKAEGEEEAHVKFAPPVFLPVPRADGSYSHLRGQHGVVVLLSDDGALLALNGRGQKLWHRFFDVAWDASGGDTDAPPPTPTLVPMALRPHAIPAAVLAVGAEGGAVVSEHGNDLATFALAFPPVAPAVVADFDGDGLNDVIIVTRGGVFGYAQVQHLGGLSFGALLLTLIAAMGIVWYNSQAADAASLVGAAAAGMMGGVMGGGAGGYGGGGYGVLSGGPAGGGQAARARKLRSTEYVD